MACAMWVLELEKKSKQHTSSTYSSPKRLKVRVHHGGEALYGVDNDETTAVLRHPREKHRRTISFGTWAHAVDSGGHLDFSRN
mmetsp:Transcript_22576/g.46315  ORF Transcript_22576/g.46315 Transcript_22576/m.46315 type:complete len:83 (+) Transcript_22576:51-299(+)